MDGFFAFDNAPNQIFLRPQRFGRADFQMKRNDLPFGVFDALVNFKIFLARRRLQKKEETFFRAAPLR